MIIEKNYHNQCKELLFNLFNRSSKDLKFLIRKKRGNPKITRENIQVFFYF